ncbi:MAG TPA: NAD-dependent epimerase/dehydratase family protein [Candidatus Cryosericum sp.]|nr:NAD-dependent epimerase/dehydratase family protein [Candidatus Cryosericum sp.]
MKILITGAGGFIGKNLISALHTHGFFEILTFDADTPIEYLEKYCADCEFVYHLAGVNRPKSQDEFMQGNFGFTDTLLRTLLRNKNRCPVMFASSAQAALPNLYGRSKKAGEELLFQYQRETGAKIYVFRFPFVFGKWSKPNYNNPVATFCYNVSHDLPVVVNDPTAQISLAYVDDLAETLIALIDETGVAMDGPYCAVPLVYSSTLGEVADRIRSFAKIRTENVLPDMSLPLTRKLYATYLSFLPTMEFAYALPVKEDEQGFSAEFLRFWGGGQVSIGVIKPGAVKGNHWHHTRTEKVLVVSGTGVIRFCSPGTDDVMEYHVGGKKLTVVDIPVGYAHNIENTGKTDLVALFWASEWPDPAHPDNVNSVLPIY